MARLVQRSFEHCQGMHAAFYVKQCPHSLLPQRCHNETEITKLPPQAEFLNFEGNNIEGTLPASWAAMQDVTYLGLDSNALSGSLPDAWSACLEVSLVTCLKVLQW